MVHLKGGERRPLNVRSVNIDAFRSELLSKFPFLSEEEKENPPVPQTWEKLRAQKLRRYPSTCQTVHGEELLDDHGMEGYVFKVTADGRGPAEAVNAGVLAGKPVPRGPPPESYTERDMIQFLRSFSSDHDAWTLENEDQNNIQVRQILSEMDGSLGWIRLDRRDMNKIIHTWGLDVGYTMNGMGFQDNPFGIMKKLVAPDTPLDNGKMRQWMHLAHYMGYSLRVFERRNWIGSGILVDGGDVLTLPFQGTWQTATQAYKAFLLEQDCETDGD
ncbi:hypothetical protein AYO20_09969 [Fonsecaea nubica]|uniref:Uncharacterized protein n=1 Tax=Fonsecaea nubica TaxID=856822 RepID=A0A178C9H7_9EURO|nr:hypothetical protein AYO20_09969 [Fonsecaea nubica]OAL26628.1 hypothetical protein AYO20_09969 [Fonsecaea nubica]